MDWQLGRASLPLELVFGFTVEVRQLVGIRHANP